MWAQWDWGEGPAVDGKKTSLFCAWLAWSRFRVVIPTRDRKLPTVIACLDQAMRNFGGAPTYWLTDNERTVTTDHIARVPVRHPLMVDFGSHYGLTITSCVSADPESKGGSEATVRIAKEDLVPTEANLRSAYSSWGELIDSCRAFMARVNGRKHRITCREPRDLLREELASLHPLPQRPYTAAFGETRKVSRLAMVSYGNVSYSVPHSLANETVWVRVEGDRLIVAAPLPEGLTEVARHRCALPGRQVIDPDHFPTAPEGALQRRPRARTKREREFLGVGENAHRWLVTAAASGVGRIGAKLEEAVILSRLHGKEKVDRALGIATDCSRFAAGDLESILVAGPLTVSRRAAGARFLQASTSGWKGFGAETRDVL